MAHSENSRKRWNRNLSAKKHSLRTTPPPQWRNVLWQKSPFAFQNSLQLFILLRVYLVYLALQFLTSRTFHRFCLFVCFFFVSFCERVFSTQNKGKKTTHVWSNTSLFLTLKDSKVTNNSARPLKAFLSNASNAKGKCTRITAFMLPCSQTWWRGEQSVHPWSRVPPRFLHLSIFYQRISSNTVPPSYWTSQQQHLGTETRKRTVRFLKEWRGDFQLPVMWDKINSVPHQKDRCERTELPFGTSNLAEKVTEYKTQFSRRKQISVQCCVSTPICNKGPIICAIASAWCSTSSYAVYDKFYLLPKN